MIYHSGGKPEQAMVADLGTQAMITAEFTQRLERISENILSIQCDFRGAYLCVLRDNPRKL